MLVRTNKRSVKARWILAICVLLASGVWLFMPAQHAKADAGDNYPAQWRDPIAQDSVVDDWGEYNRECTSWASFALSNRNGYRIPFHDYAKGWGAKATAIGYPPDNNPAVGTIAWWDANAPGASQWGHVAWVSDVDTSGGITIEQYNADFTGHYSTAYFAKGSSKWPTGFIHFPGSGGSTTPTPTPAPAANILAIKSSLSADGTIEVFAATTGRVTLGWYRNGGDGAHTLPIIDIAQQNIVGIDKLNVDNTELVYTAVPDGVWESSRVNGSSTVANNKIVTGLSGVRGVIAENTFEGGYRVHHLYILAADGPHEAYWKDSDPTHTIHVGLITQINGGVTFTHSIAPNGAEQLYVAVPTWVYEVSWTPGSVVNVQTVINIPQADIRSVEKGANLPDGGELLYTTTSTTVWQSYRNGTGAFNQPGTITMGQSNALQGLKSVTPDGWHHVFLALPDHVQEYKWLGSGTGGGEIIRIPQGNITSIAQQLDGNNQLLFTAAGSYVWETWWNASTGYNTPPTALFGVSA